MSLFPAGRTLAVAGAAALLAAAMPSAAAAATRAGLTGKINPVKVKRGAPLRLTVGFTLDPDVRGEGGTISRVVLQFPNNAVHNGKLFPSCAARTINIRGGRFSGCPKGSLIGRGSLRADVPAVPVWNVPGRVTLFNGPGGKSLTVHIYATNPVLISEAFDAPIVRTRGKYGYRLTANIPELLQELNGEGGGWFPQVRRFETTVGATRVVKGKKRGFIEGRSCPKSRKAPIAGTFSFRHGGSASATGIVRCKR